MCAVLYVVCLLYTLYSYANKFEAKSLFLYFPLNEYYMSLPFVNCVQFIGVLRGGGKGHNFFKIFFKM